MGTLERNGLGIFAFSPSWHFYSILAQSSISIPPENVRKPSGGIEMKHWVKMG